MTRLEQLFDGTLPRLVMFDLDGTLMDSVPDRPPRWTRC